jgi:hypothetical protein
MSQPYYLKSSFVIVIFLTFFHISVKAQSTEKLTFLLPQNKVTNSLYNKMTLVDLRPDTSNMGIVQTGAFNKKATVVTKAPLNIQLDNILASLIDNTAKSQELVLQLWFISFAEETGGFTESGSFSLNAQLYAKTNNGYRKINTIDTVAKVSSAMDVTNALLKKGGETLSNFISANLRRQPSNYNYTFNEIEKADSVEKSKLIVYTTNTYNDGLYLTYKSFCDQIPDKKVTVDGDSVKRNNVKAPDETGQFKKVTSGKYYAVVYKGKPYISSPFGNYPLTKINNDFFFSGKLSDNTNYSYMAMGSMYGAIGGAIAGAATAAASGRSYFEYKIFYKNGQSIRLSGKRN